MAGSWVKGREILPIHSALHRDLKSGAMCTSMFLLVNGSCCYPRDHPRSQHHPSSQTCSPFVSLSLQTKSLFNQLAKSDSSSDLPLIHSCRHSIKRCLLIFTKEQNAHRTISCGSRRMENTQFGEPEYYHPTFYNTVPK